MQRSKADRTRSANKRVDPRVLPRTVQRLIAAGLLRGVPSDLLYRIGIAEYAIPYPVDAPRQLEFEAGYLGEHLLSKFDDGKPSPEKRARTWDRFYTAEEQCKRANERLAHPLTLSYSTGVSVWSVIETARRKIGWLLGDYRESECAAARCFTSGASLLRPRRKGDSAYKYSGIPETTVGILSPACQMIFEGQMTPWQNAIAHHRSYRVFDGNKVQCVPKNWKTDRTIAIEPSLNMYFQKGIGVVLRRRLKRVGIDLDDQTINQRHALLGSVNDDRATLDLSMASDTISHELVCQLLPPDWLLALEQCRSPVGVLPSGKKIVYRKFSSMGNGYTFELESLIFWALSSAVTELFGGDASLVSVYGDDLVVDKYVAPPLCDVLSYCGFTINDSKSFVEGPFRESCGKHYRLGKDVTPFYVKRPVDRLSELFLLHNKLYRWAVRISDRMTDVDKETVVDILREIRSYAPTAWRRPRIPDGTGDGAFIGTFDECLPSRPVGSLRSRKGQLKFPGWEGWSVDVLVQQGTTVVPGEEGLVVNGARKSRLIAMETGFDWGYLCARLSSPSPSGWEDRLFPEEGGGLTLSPRYRVITTLVPHFNSLLDALHSREA